MTSIKTRNRRRPKGRQSKQGDAVGQYASDAWSLAKRTAYGLNEIRKLINIETKFLDTVQTAAGQSTTGNVYPLTQLAQGLTSTDRVGDSIKIQHIELRGRVVVNNTATTSLARVIVFRDLDGFGVSPTAANLLQSTGTVSAPLSSYKFNNMERFSVIHDELIAVDTQGSLVVPVYVSLPHGGHVKYLGTTAAAVSNGKGSVYVMCISDEGTNTPTFAFYARVTFTDD